MTNTELGVYSFDDRAPDPRTHTNTTTAGPLGHLVRMAQIADQAGLDVFGLGEHHRADFAVAAPEVVLAHIAATTSRIRLNSAITVLSHPRSRAHVPAVRNP